MAIYSEFYHYKWWFSIVMLVYQRVWDKKIWDKKCYSSIIHMEMGSDMVCQTKNGNQDICTWSGINKHEHNQPWQYWAQRMYSNTQEDQELIHYYIWLVVSPLWKIWKSVGVYYSKCMDIFSTCSKPPTRYSSGNVRFSILCHLGLSENRVYSQL